MLERHKDRLKARQVCWVRDWVYIGSLRSLEFSWPRTAFSGPLPADGRLTQSSNIATLVQKPHKWTARCFRAKPKQAILNLRVGKVLARTADISLQIQ